MTKSIKRNFLLFFDDVIQHHLPDVQVEIESKYNPRLERPPAPPPMLDKDGKSAHDILIEWGADVLATEIKNVARCCSVTIVGLCAINMAMLINADSFSLTKS